MPQYWFVVEALAVLYSHLKASRAAFTRDQLKAWSPRFQERPTGAQHALDHLERCAMVRRLTGTPAAKPLKQGAWRYQLTTAGAVMATAAAETQRHARMSAAGKKGAQARTRSQDSFAARLWALFRMRRTITAPEAAATLVDAGGDVPKAANAAAQYLGRWSRLHPDAIQTSKQRGPRGARRFVLVRDLGPIAPAATPPIAKAHGGAAT